MNWSWSDIEDAAMDYLPHRAQVMYLRVLRRRMDFDTCIVGITVRLSYMLIAEWLEERPAVRSNKPIVRLTVSEMRAVFAMLERVGLVERVLDKNNEVLPLVFKLPLARTGLIRPKYERQQKPECTTEICEADSNVINDLFKPVNTSVSSDFGVVDKSQNNSLKNAMSDSKKTDERQTSGSNNIFNNNIYTFRARNSERLPSLMDSGWLPGVETVEKLVINFGLPPQFIFVQAVDFRLLWIEQRRAVADWDGYFYGACRIQIENGNEDFMRAINNKSGGGYGGA